MTNLPQATQISPEVVKAIGENASNIAGEMTDAAINGPEGWHVAPYDPNDLLPAFPLLRMKSNYHIASYQFREGGNGNGFPFVIPGDKTLPPPDGNLEFGWLETGEVRLEANSSDLPEWVECEISSFLEGDHSPESYLQASLFIRELRELGALWHGSYWSSHTVLASLPAQLTPHLEPVDEDDEEDDVDADEDDQYTPTEWEWKLAKPDDWRPTVSCREDGGLTVAFYTYSGLGQEAIYLHSDVYKAEYSFQTTREAAATGGGGYIY